jgi:trigger factor
MQVNKIQDSPTKVTLEISAKEADLAPIKKHVISHFVRTAKVPGFRVGKAPANLVEKNIDQQRLFDEFMEHALNDLYSLAVKEADIRPIANPEVSLKKFVPFTDLEFSLNVEVLGPVKLPDYKKIKLDKPKVSVTAKEVNDVLDGLKIRMAERKEVERAAKDGDEVVIDFSGKDSKGEPVAGADGRDYPLTLGSNSFIPGFEDNVVGMKPNGEKEFTITFPKDYGVKALQSKKVTFKITVKKVNELVEPKLDDEFAGKVGPFKTVDELKADIKKQLKAEREQQAAIDFENKLIKEISAQSKADVPESLIQDQILSMEQAEKQNLMYRGQTWEEHLKEEGVTEEQHRERNRPDAEERVKASLVLSEIAEQEKLEVTPEEVEIRAQILKGQYQDAAMQAEVDKSENRRDIASRILTEKTVEKLVSYASK